MTVYSREHTCVLFSFIQGDPGWCASQGRRPYIRNLKERGAMETSEGYYVLYSGLFLLKQSCFLWCQVSSCQSLLFSLRHLLVKMHFLGEKHCLKSLKGLSRSPILANLIPQNTSCIQKCSPSSRQNVIRTCIFILYLKNMVTLTIFLNTLCNFLR